MFCLAVSGQHFNKLATSESQIAAGGDLTQKLCQGRIQEFLIGGGSKFWFRKDCWTLLRQITSPPHTPYPHSPSHQPRLHVIIPCRLTVYLDSTCKGCTLGTSSSCVWLQRLYRFRQHQCQGHDVSAWVQVLTTAHQTSCFWDMTWFVASQRMNAQLRQNLQEGRKGTTNNKQNLYVGVHILISIFYTLDKIFR